MKEKKEDMVRKTPASQVFINTRVRNSEDHMVLIHLQLRDQLRLPIVRLFYRHRQLLVHQEVLRSAQAIGSETILLTPSIASAPRGSLRGLVSPFCTHCERRHKGEYWRLTGACLACGSNEHKIKDCPRARSFTSPRTGGTVSATQKSNKDNKSVASPIAPRQATHTIGRQDACALARAYAMKAMEDKDAPDVIVGKFSIFETNVYALIDPGSCLHFHSKFG